jgi:ElaB/YqjD/DUF883 family membrane-anchored ribosome-binding protein
MADVEDLVTRVAAVKDPEIALVRNKVIKTLDAARTSISASAGRVREHAVKVTGTTNHFVRENPWQVVRYRCSAGRCGMLSGWTPRVARAGIGPADLSAGPDLGGLPRADARTTWRQGLIS